MNRQQLNKAGKIIPKQTALIIIHSLILWIFGCDNGNGAIQRRSALWKCYCVTYSTYIWWCLIKKRYVLFLNIYFIHIENVYFPLGPHPSRCSSESSEYGLAFDPVGTSLCQCLWMMNDEPFFFFIFFDESECAVCDALRLIMNAIRFRWQFDHTHSYTHNTNCLYTIQTISIKLTIYKWNKTNVFWWCKRALWTSRVLCIHAN